VTVSAAPMDKSVDTIPMIFEAKPDAAPGAKFCAINVKPTEPPKEPAKSAEVTQPTGGMPPPSPANPAPTQPAASCNAAIDTSPATARVLLDGGEIGVGSLENVVVPCGREFNLKVEHAGYKTFERRFTAESGVPLRIDAALTRQEPVVSKKSRLRIVSDPDGAILTVDGKVVGRGSASVTSDIGDTVFVTVPSPDRHELEKSDVHP